MADPWKTEIRVETADERIQVEIIDMYDHILIRFDRPLTYLSFPLDKAEEFANGILKVINEIKAPQKEPFQEDPLCIRQQSQTEQEK